MLSTSSFSVLLLGSLVWTGLLFSTVHASAIDISPRSPFPGGNSAAQTVDKGTEKKTSGFASGAGVKKTTQKTTGNANLKCYGEKLSVRKRDPKGKGKAIEGGADSCGILAAAQDHTSCDAGAISITFPENKLTVGKGKATGVECDVVYDMNLLAFALDGVCTKFHKAIELISPHIDEPGKAAMETGLKAFAAAAVKEVAGDPANHRFLSSAEHKAKQQAFADFTVKKKITKDQTMNNVAAYLAMDLLTIDSKVSNWKAGIDGEMVTMRTILLKEYKTAQPKMCKKDIDKVFSYLQTARGKSNVLVVWHAAIKQIGVTQAKPLPQIKITKEEQATFHENAKKLGFPIGTPPSPSTDSSTDSDSDIGGSHR